ncbi:ABC transporter permease [Blastococcus sp. TF02A-26]|uniref:ABC transporter permease n=1 Tax=Blastococcus sp. TF02A-26 TaxID=2250577 RepID=UPI000DE9EFF6|nr:ABC transporter permease [Blastococcus sp. TF02A-26]RBY84288.1 ABC transporter permease [Blastococcus sp. TF02A-26]
MNDLQRAFQYLNDPFNWTRRGGILDLLHDHLVVSAVAVLAAMVVALPLGVVLGRARRGSGAVVVLSNVSRAIPTLALLTVFAVTPVGFGDRATMIALAVFAIPPILTNTFVGFRGVDADVREAARAMGMSGGQLLRRVEAPLAAPLVLTGIRTAAVQVVATATLAALVGGSGLGRLINLGFGQRDYGVMYAGAFLVAALALLTELLLVVASWAVTPGQRRLPFRPVTRASVERGQPEPTASGVPL